MTLTGLEGNHQNMMQEEKEREGEMAVRKTVKGGIIHDQDTNRRKIQRGWGEEEVKEEEEEEEEEQRLKRAMCVLC